MARKPLREIPRSQQPLSFDSYALLYGRLDAAADRFADIGLNDLATEMEAVRDRLARAWAAITTAEREGR
ncbi:hypothetical protein [Magnetospirillum molischianum]|uniref:Uncharacterized protein n=1 Tax=Magnetospirillum molischianum DSM 120 TaxID=1150626 RepID=H8FUW8_MAGML|nr:hypothetical protein [Magnetospirillum molischianum]CCG42156.1 hypothetical protein PHAMO_340029 [Magnetospirillum molischianum DSM 120]